MSQLQSYQESQQQGTTIGARALVTMFWAGAESDQKVLVKLGFLSLMASFGCIIAFAILGGPLEGSISWRKPILFAFFLGIMQLNIAALLSFLPKWKWRPIFTTGAIGYAITLQITLIILQQARGTLSHFNWFTGPLNTFIARILIVVAVSVFIAILVFTWKAFQKLDLQPSLRRTIRFGLVMLSIGPVLGGAITANTFNNLFILNMRGITDFHTFGEAGNLLVPHLFSLNVLPVMTIGYIFMHIKGVCEEERMHLVNAFSYASILFLLLSCFQTFTGSAPFDFNVVSGAVFAVSTGLYFYFWLKIMLKSSGGPMLIINRNIKT